MNDKENDPNDLLVCPYDAVHRISRKRYPYHLAKCRKQYASAGWARCSFNARHEVPVEELEYHMSICPDKDTIRRDIEEIISRAELQQKMSHQPQPTIPSQPDETEDWESEANGKPFSIGGSYHQDEATDAYDIVQAMQRVQVQAFPTQSQPYNTTGLSAAQKKNLKRAQKRQEKREAEGLVEENGITDEQLLADIIKEYGILNKAHGSFVDFVSILNQYCQKSRINTPKYLEDSGVDGGFGAKVFVKGEIFTTSKYCSTKKEARHDAAKCALLGLNIPVVDPTPNKPMAARTAVDRQRLRETHELQLFNEAAVSVQARGRGQPVLKAPTSFTGPPSSVGPSLFNQMTSSSEPSVESARNNLPKTIDRTATSNSEDDEWTTVGKKGVKNPVYQYSLKMAGRGRGMTRR